MPGGELNEFWQEAINHDDPFSLLARRFKVSALVAARRALDVGLVSHDEFLAFYRAYETDERRKMAQKGSGGSFWNNQNVRIGRRFGAAVVRAAKEGRLLYSEAYRLTGLRGATFDHFAESLGHPAP